MAIPTYDKFIEPILRYLAKHLDGERLAELMIEYGVGVSHRLVKIPKIDSDYFEE